MKLLLACTLATALAPAAPCIRIDGDRILAADLVAHSTIFARLDPELPVGLAPLPGARRILSGRDLADIASKNGVAASMLENVCFERALSPLNADRIRQAMRASLDYPDAHIDIVDFDRVPFPSGELIFPRSGVMAGPSAAPGDAVMWHGKLRFGPRHTMPVWARVRITRSLCIVEAARLIRPGALIAADDLRVVQREVSVFTNVLRSEEEALGRLARRTIAAGTPLGAELLQQRPDIARGDRVRITSIAGYAQISFEAVARSAGRKGERILLVNPQNQRTFRALVDGKGLAHVEAGT
jgi:flagella basal body P-ring formation protein FlgA